MNRPCKADIQAADRVLKAACRRAIELARSGEDSRPVLTAAGVVADLLLEAS